MFPAGILLCVFGALSGAYAVLAGMGYHAADEAAQIGLQQVSAGFLALVGLLPGSILIAGASIRDAIVNGR